MKTANELANKLMILHIAQAHEWSSSATSDAAAMLRSQAAEIESLRKANIDCKLHFDTLKADYDALKADAERLDWLEQNLFNRENVDWVTGKVSETHRMWVTFAPTGVQGSARAIIDAAIEAAKETP